MGFLDKVKNMFTEEIEEEPIKKDVIQVEIPAPTVERREERTTESETLVREEKPQTPVFFDDKDFASLERKEEKKPKNLEDKYRGKEEEKKVFRPTPIISPVYGVLDKNYHKEDIKPKKDSRVVSNYDKTAVTIDDVRKKAFGTLEDELETVIPSDDYAITEENNVSLEINNSQDDILDDLMDNDYQPKFGSYEEDNAETLNDEVEEKDMFEEMHEEMQKEDEDLSESDLFNLIDSMYERKEGDE